MNPKPGSPLLIGMTLITFAGCGIDSSPTPPTPLPLTATLVVSGRTSSGGVDKTRGPWLGMVPQETVQLTAVATFSDGTERNVTAECAWSSRLGQGYAVSLIPYGRVQANQVGWAAVEALYRSTSPSAVASVNIRVAPENTFLLEVTAGSGPVSCMLPEFEIRATSAAGTFSAWACSGLSVVVAGRGETVVEVTQGDQVLLKKSVTLTSDTSAFWELDAPAAREPASTTR